MQKGGNGTQSLCLWCALFLRNLPALREFMCAKRQGGSPGSLLCFSCGLQEASSSGVGSRQDVAGVDGVRLRSTIKVPRNLQNLGAHLPV